MEALLTAEEMRSLRAADEMEENYCSSHDYLDANEVMLTAFIAVTGREPDWDSVGDLDLINTAWDTAKATSWATGEEK
jgi:hypothetical protein